MNVESVQSGRRHRRAQLHLPQWPMSDRRDSRGSQGSPDNQGSQGNWGSRGSWDSAGSPGNQDNLDRHRHRLRPIGSSHKARDCTAAPMDAAVVEVAADRRGLVADRRDLVVDNWARGNVPAEAVVADHTDADAGYPLKYNSNDVDVVLLVWR